MKTVYGDHIHQNPGTHLSGGIAEDALWQERWRQLISFPSHAYDVPSGAVGKRFVEKVADELKGIRSRKWNSERFLVLQVVVLQRTRDVKRARDVRRRISKRLDAWEKGQFTMLVEDTLRSMETHLTSKQGKTTPEQRTKTFHQKVLRGNIRGAVRYLTEREKGGILYPDDIDEKTGKTVQSVLESKHPDARTPGVDALTDYPFLPDFVDLDITEDSIEVTARRLSGGAGLGGTDAHALQQWLLRFGRSSRLLRQATADLVDWMANSFPPWAAYRALMAGRLVALDKCPGVRPIGVGETWRRLAAKATLLVSGSDAKELCGIHQLCAGLEAGIEGGIHAIEELWKQHEEEEEWGFLLVDASNAFNELNRTAMLWTIRHEWPSGARFAFNCYRHWATLVIRGKGGSMALLYSKEGVTQGDPLSMFGYGIGIMPLIRRLKHEFPAVKQPWYADDAGAGGSFTDLRQFFLRLQEIGPAYGYFPEPTKSILIVRAHNRREAKSHFHDLRFQVETGSRYLGGYIGSRADRELWVQEKVAFWTSAVTDLAFAALSHPQTAFAGLQKSLQHEWQFIQRVIEDIGDCFFDLEEAITDIFLPALYGESLKDCDYRRKLSALPVKYAGLAIPDPSATSEENFEASTLVCSHLLAAFRGVEPFSSHDHKTVRTAVTTELRSRRSEKMDSTLVSLLSGLDCDTRRTILRGKETGQWLSVMPSTLNGTELSAQEFRDALLLRHARTPGDLPSHCDGCGAKFDVRHALGCKKGGLVILRHNEINEELCDLASKALVPSAVRVEPMIQTRRAAEGTTAPDPKSPVQRLSRSSEEERGDLLIRGFWARGTDVIVDVRVTDTDAKSYRSRDPHKVLASQEAEKKKKYLQACLEQRRHFTPFVVSTDGLIGQEAGELLKRLSLRLAEKWERPYSVVRGFVNARMSIAIVRATHLCLRGSRVPLSQISRRPLWEDRAGLGLFKTDY
jgi:hypothetical protein